MRENLIVAHDVADLDGATLQSSAGRRRKPGAPYRAELTGVAAAGRVLDWADRSRSYTMWLGHGGLWLGVGAGDSWRTESESRQRRGPQQECERTSAPLGRGGALGSIVGGILLAVHLCVRLYMQPLRHRRRGVTSRGRLTLLLALHIQHLVTRRNQRTPSSADEVAEVVAGDCLAVRVRLLNRAITAIYDDALRPLGLTAGQLNVLVMIKRNGPVSPTEIAERLHMEKSTVSRNIARMRDHGWLITAESAPGQRQELTLSRKGSALLVRSYSAWHKAQADAGTALGRGGAESILRTANAVWGGP